MSDLEISMVHAWVAQKLLKCDIFKSFYDVRFRNIYGDYWLMTRYSKRVFEG
jgi:hypothetical protein